MKALARHYLDRLIGWAVFTFWWTILFAVVIVLPFYLLERVANGR